MANIIALLTLLGSAAGIIVILWRKFAILSELVLQEQDPGFRDLLSKSTRKLGDSRKMKSASEKVLHKTLSKTRVLAMKTESKTGDWLQQLRKKSEERKEKFSEEYWDQFKKRGNRP